MVEKGLRKVSLMFETNKLIRKLSIGNEKLYALTKEDIAKVQAVLLEMMNDFDSLCRKHGLTYFLVGGTALGAVRHKGFIPWDEDVDLAMPRKDYDRLTTLVLAEYSEKYWVQDIKTNERYDLPFLKIRKKGTRFVEVFEPDPAHAGIFMDVYPLENIPDFALWRWLHGVLSMGLAFCCSCVRMNQKKERYFTYYDDPKMHKIVKIKSFIGGLLGFLSLRRWCLLTDKVTSCCKKENTKYVSFPSGRKHYFGEMCQRSSILPVRESDFAGRRFFLPAKPEEHLTVLYGDYQKIPLANEREQHTVLELKLGEENE